MANKLQIKRTTVAGRLPNTTNSGNTTFIDAGELAINVTDGKLFSSNGSALIEFGTGTPVYDESGTLISNTFVTTRTADLGALTVDVIPAADNTYNLGNSTRQWRHLYVSSNTIFLGNTPVSVSGGSLLVNNSPVSAATTDNPAFSAYANNTYLQTITSGSQQKVLFQTEEYDTHNCYADSRFTPTSEGYYQLNAMVRLDGDAGSAETMITLWKNGAPYKRGWNAQGGSTSNSVGWFAMSVSSIVYANGTTDYFEIYVQQTSGSTRYVTGVADTGITYFNGVKIGGGGATLIPSQTGNSGKYLTTNGSVISWGTVAGGDSLPTQTGNSGKYLTTDGTSASWATVAGGGGAGSIINVTQVVKTDTFISASTSWANVTGLSVTVTPASASSKFLLISDISTGPNAGAGSYAQRFAKNGSAITAYIGDAASNRPRAMGVAYPGDNAGTAPGMGLTKLYLDSPATTANVTYTVQVAGSTTTPGYINRSQADRDTSGYDARTASSFTVIEIAG